MPTKDEKSRPLLVAVWPGLGQVALTAGYYLMSRLHMHETKPLPAQDLFDVDQVDVENGLVQTARLPKTRIFLWKDPEKRQDIVVLIGEAQPPAGKLTFCERLLDYADRLGVQEVFTFAGMVTDSALRSPSRVFGVATTEAEREKVRRSGAGILSAGHLAGMNGILLGVAARRGLQGIGLLGEMPAVVTQVPFAKASAAVLEVFGRLTGIRLELQELEEYGRAIENQLAEAIETFERAVEPQQAEVPPEQAEPAEARDAAAKPDLSERDRWHVESLFSQALRDRSKTFELKRELDRLGVFALYEDRFLDLFRTPRDPEPGA
jgi:proteasome assembly chaperone (PAC2) family protein